MVGDKKISRSPHPLSVDLTLILASGSPRRKDILNQLGFEFLVDPSGIDENTGKSDSMKDPEELVINLAGMKYDDVCTRHQDRIVVAADTIVCIDGEILGKPENREQAGEMLAKLSGRTHEVMTGLVLGYGCSGKRIRDREITHVGFRSLKEDEVNWYLDTGEGYDKAGAYGIQGFGAALVERIEGCYFNVVGFPVSLFLDMLRELRNG